MRYDDICKVPSIAITEGSIPEGAKLTIAIPTYKRGELLKETLESCLAQQTNYPFAIMVVDNSPERGCDTEKLMQEYSYTHSNISYYKNSENIGMIGNWNKLFELSKTEFVTMLHDDDLLDENYVQKIYEVLNIFHYDVNGIYVKHFIFRDIKEIIKNSQTSRIVHLSPFDFIFGMFSTISGGCYKKETIIKLNGFNQEYDYLGDYMLSYALTKKGKVLKIENTPLLYYRCVHNTSSSADTTLKIIKDYEKATKIILLDYPLYKKLYPSFFKYLIKKNVIEEQKRVFNTQDPRLDEKYNEITKSITPYDKIVYLFWRILRKVIFFSKRLYQKRI